MSGAKSINPTEHQEAKAFAKQCALQEGKYPALKNLFSVPNGGDRHKIVAAKMKAEGQKPGVPDYILLYPSGDFHGLVIELKSMTGSASREQKDWIERLRKYGYKAEVCKGAERAWEVVKEYLELT